MSMPSRTAKFASAILVGILASAPFTAISHSQAVAADDCLSNPKGEPSSGSHWYYRIEHGTKRHCWYLRTEGDRVSQSAPKNLLPPAKPPAPQADPAPQHSVANAHAELPAQTNRNDAPPAPWPANPAALNDTPQADAPDTNAISPLVASRWPDPSGVSPASSPRPATSNVAANVPASSTAAPAPAVAPVTLAAADTSLQSRPHPVPKSFVAVASAFALFGIMASLIFKFSRMRRQRRAKIRARRRPVWESTDDNRIALSDYPDADVLPRRSRFATSVGETRHPEDRMSDFLSQMSGRAPT
jgi:hypothetical protein